MSEHVPHLDPAGLRTVVAHNIVAPAGWPGWIALSEAMASGEYAPQTDVEATWRMFTTQTYASSILPLVATREALQNSIDAVRLFGRFRRWGKYRTREDALNALISDKGLGERFWTAMAAGTVPALPADGTNGRFDVTWDADTRTLTWSDDGIGMDVATLHKAFFTIPGTRKGAQGGGSEQTAGGFGIAKAVILGCGTGGFAIHTRDNLALGWFTSADTGARVYRVSQGTPRVGTTITIKDVIWNYSKDYTTKALTAQPVDGPFRGGDGRNGASLLSMLREVLSVSDLPGLTMTLNNQEVTTAFPGRGKSHPELGGAWMKHDGATQVEATVKSYRRDDKDGAVYVRLNGLYQFRTPGYGDLDRDYVVDLDVKLTPDDPGYPLLNSREGFKRPVLSAYESMVEHVKATGRDPAPEQKDYDTFLPARKDRDEAAGGREIEATVEATLAAPAVKEALNAAMGAAAETLDAMFRDRDAETREIRRHQATSPVDDASQAGKYDYSSPDDPSTRDAVDAQDVGALPPTAPRATFDFTVPQDYDAPTAEVSDPGSYAREAQEREEILAAVTVIDKVLTAAKLHLEKHDTNASYSIRADLREALYALASIVKYPTDSYYRGEYELKRVLAGLRAAVTLAYRPAGNGVFDVMRIRPALTALAYLAKLSGVGTSFALELARVSPFGGLGALKIKRYVGSEYPEAVKARRRAYVYRFRKGYAKWVPYLLVWDATLRILAKEGALVRKKGSERSLLEYLPDFYPGFVLDPGVHGMAATEATEDDRTVNVIYINPDDFAAVVKAQRTRPMAIAGFLHNLACHELTHLNGNMGKGHERDFVIEREFLANATCHLLPVIEAVVVHVLQLPPPAALHKAQKRIEKLEAKVEGLVGEKRALERQLARREAPVPAREPALDVGALAHAFAQQVRIHLGQHRGVDVAALVHGALHAFLARPGIPTVMREHEDEIRTRTIRLLSNQTAK